MMKDMLPAIFSLTLSGMYGVIDGLFIGKSTGDTGLAAINIAWPVTAVITATGIGIGTGGGVLFSFYKGKGDETGSRSACHNTMALLLLAGISATFILLLGYPSVLKILGAGDELFREASNYSEIIVKGSLFQILGTGLIPVLRSMDMAVEAMSAMILGLVLNISINYYLMFRMGLGIRGAAYGTVISQAVVALVSVVLLKCWAGQSPRPEVRPEKAGKIIRIGIPAFGVSLAPSVTLVFTNWQCLRYGGDAAVACYAVISYIVFPVQSMLSGVGDGTQPLASYLNGAGKKEELARLSRAARRTAGTIGVAAAGVSIFTAEKIGGWFGLSAEASVYFVPGMVISASAFCLLGLTRFNLSFLNAVMQTEKAMVLTYTESILVTPLLLYILPLIWGMEGIWVSLPMTAVCMLMLNKIYKGKGER